MSEEQIISQEVAAPQEEIKEQGVVPTQDDQVTENVVSTAEDEHEDSNEVEEFSTPQRKKLSGAQRSRQKIARLEEEKEYYRQLALRNDVKPQYTEPQKDNNVKPKVDDYSSLEDWVEAVSDWKANEVLKKAKKDAEAENLAYKQRENERKWLEKEQSYLEKYEDYEEVADANELVRHNALNQTMIQALLETPETGPDVLYYLGKNIDEARRIAALPPILAAKELGKIEDRLINSNKNVKKVKTTNAPPPIQPIAAKAGAVALPTKHDRYIIY